MSLPEKLIKSAKAGNSREVRKLLGRGVSITKDKVSGCCCMKLSLRPALVAGIHFARAKNVCIVHSLCLV